jgi:hypothetical protein
MVCKISFIVEQLRDLFVEEIWHKIVRAEHCRLQSAFEKIREPEG